MMLRSLTVLTTLAMALPCQGRNPDEGGVILEKRAPVKKVDPAGDDAAAEKEGPDGASVKMTPEQIANAAARRGAGNLCRFYLHTKPAKLMPGQSGTIIITAALGGAAVMASPTPLEVVSPMQQGMFSIGNPEFAPAKVAQETAPAFAGRPVYDNTARIELPVTLAAGAKVGQQLNLVVEMRFELFDGKSGQSIGKFLDRATGQLEVGASHDPAVVGGYTPPAVDSAGPQAGAAHLDDSAVAAAQATGKEAIGAAAPAPVSGQQAAPAPAKPTSSTSLEVPEEGGFPPLLLIGGGALLAAVVLLLLGRRK
ncbi:MAG: hypothetical protein U1E73_08110 [Planctomycetota bacterium]